MRNLLIITAVAVLIRLATAVDPAAAAILVGAMALGAAGFGLWSNARVTGTGWLWRWSLITIGLVGNVASAVYAGLNNYRLGTDAAVVITATLVGDLAAVIGLAGLLHFRLPGRAAETLSASSVAVMALVFPILALVVVPDLGWHPGRQLPVILLPLVDIVLLRLAVDALSLTDRHPMAYRYLVGGLACLLGAHAAAAALFLDGTTSSPIPVNAVVLWGTCLWGCSILHPSHRKPLDPVPFRSSRPRGFHVTLMVLSAMVAPATRVARSVMHIDANPASLGAVSSLLPMTVVGYLLYQVFARSAAEHRAQHDPLTGVCNRVLFNDRLDAAIAEARRNGHRPAVMFLDLDRFKSINDSLGHTVGNQVLQAVVKRLQGRLRRGDTLARMGGDEFTILFPAVEDSADLADIGRRFLNAFKQPFYVGGKLLQVQTSIGIASYPEDGEDAETLFKNADTAMYQAKAAGRNTFVVYNSTMSAKAELRFALESSLRATVEGERLTIHYQPKISTVDGRIIGAEALARWHHPELGFIPPSAFIPLAEETSLISTLGEWVLEAACYQARAWQLRGLPDLTVAVNVSPRQFARQSVVRMVSGVLERTQLDPRLLELEVTESLLIEHMEDTAACLAELRAMGVRCSIDDFGTGYSALKYLTDMPVDAIKIDPSFVRRIDSESGTASIVGAVIDLAHTLGLKVTAEGVETVDQFRFLTEHGCDYVQGYLWSRPVPADELEELVTRGGPAPAERSLVSTGGPFAGSRMFSEARLEEILAGLTPGNGWTNPDREELMAVLTALQSDEVVTVIGPRGVRLVPARMAVGTLAGLASVAGTLGATGVLPVVEPQLVSEVLQQATGFPLPTGSDGPPSMALVADGGSSHPAGSADGFGVVDSGGAGVSGSGSGAEGAPAVAGPPAAGPSGGAEAKGARPGGGPSKTGGVGSTPGGAQAAGPGSGSTGGSTPPAPGAPSGGTVPGGGSSGGGSASGGGAPGSSSGSGGGTNGDGGSTSGGGGSPPGGGGSGGNGGSTGSGPGAGSGQGSGSGSGSGQDKGGANSGHGQGSGAGSGTKGAGTGSSTAGSGGGIAPGINHGVAKGDVGGLPSVVP